MLGEVAPIQVVELCLYFTCKLELTLSKTNFAKVRMKFKLTNSEMKLFSEEQRHLHHQQIIKPTPKNKDNSERITTSETAVSNVPIVLRAPSRRGVESEHFIHIEN